MKALLALLLALVASAADATQDRWPAMYDVTDVPAGDVLNLRADPDASAPIVGTLPRDARDIELIRPNDRETWALVNIGETTGWVSLAFMRRQPGQWYGALPDRMMCAGTEPFWSLEIDQGRMIYESPDTGRQEGRIDAVNQSRNHPGRHAVVGIFERGDDQTYLDGVGLIANEACSDGMSDRAYGYALDLILGNMEGFVLQSGCCSLSR